MIENAGYDRLDASTGQDAPQEPLSGSELASAASALVSRSKSLLVPAADAIHAIGEQASGESVRAVAKNAGKKALGAARETWRRFTHNTRVGYAMSDKYWDARAAVSKAKKGYSSIDVRNLGPTFAERQADILAYLSAQTYGSLGAEEAERLKGGMLSASRAIRGYLAIYDDLSTLFLSDGFGSNAPDGSRTPDEIVKEATSQARAAFLDAWRWTAENVYVDGFTPPDELAALKDRLVYGSGDGACITAMDEQRAFRVDPDLAAAAATKISGIAAGARRVAERVASPSGFSASDVAMMPHGELLRLAELLREMAGATFGEPVNYAFGDGLKERGDGWGERQSLAASIYGNRSVVADIIHKRTPEGHIEIAKNGENPDYAAWIEDIVYAKDVIERYAEWHGAGGFRKAMEYARVDESAVEEFDARIGREFMNAWMWIGENMEALWV